MGMTLAQLAAEKQNEYKDEIILANVNGKLKELGEEYIPDSDVTFVTTSTSIGNETYRRSVVLLMLAAIDKIDRNIDRVVVEYSLSKGLYCTFDGDFRPDKEFIDEVKSVMHSMVEKDLPIKKELMKISDAMNLFKEKGMTDKTSLFKYRRSSSVTEAITSSGGSSVTFTVARDGKNVDVTVEPKMVEVESYDTGFVVYGDRVKTSPIGTLKYSVKEVGYSVKTVIQSLGMLFTGKIGFDSLLGPVGTVSTMSEIVEESKADGAFYVFLNLMNLAALISANLGVMNLLPIPALDGGRLVFLIIEALRGKPVKREHEGIVNFIGMILLVILMVVVLFKDIMALF